jgi:hypothetical protein
MFIFYCFGVIFDDGGNFVSEGEDAYNTDFNDYILVNPWVVALLSMFRISIGDLQAP